MTNKNSMSFWRKPENEDKPMEACSQPVACRLSEVCHSVAKESRNKEIYKNLLYILIKQKNYKENKIIINRYTKAIITTWIPDDKSYNLTL